MQIFVANKLTTIFPLLHNRVVKEQKMAYPAMGTPNLSGFYYRMTDFVASQLYHLSDIIKANSAIRGSNLHRHSICQRMENQDQI